MFMSLQPFLDCLWYLGVEAPGGRMAGEVRSTCVICGAHAGCRARGMGAWVQGSLMEGVGELSALWRARA